jgi:hypothetical protein
MRKLSSQANAHSNGRQWVCQAQPRTILEMQISYGSVVKRSKTRAAAILPSPRLQLDGSSDPQHSVFIPKQSEAHLFGLAAIVLDRHCETPVGASSFNV